MRIDRPIEELCAWHSSSCKVDYLNLYNSISPHISHHHVLKIATRGFYNFFALSNTTRSTHGEFPSLSPFVSIHSGFGYARYPYSAEKSKLSSPSLSHYSSFSAGDMSHPSKMEQVLISLEAAVQWLPISVLSSGISHSNLAAWQVANWGFGLNRRSQLGWPRPKGLWWIFICLHPLIKDPTHSLSRNSTTWTYMVMKVEVDVLLEYYTTKSCKAGVVTRVCGLRRWLQLYWYSYGCSEWVSAR